MPPALVPTLPPSEALCSPGETGIGQAERQQLRIELLEGHARLDDRDLVLGVDLPDAVHPVEGQQDAVGHGHGGTRKPSAAAAGDDRHPVLGGDTQHLGDLVRRAGQHEGQREHGRDGQGLVVRVVGVDGLADEDVALAYGLAQLFQKIRHATATPTSGRSGRTDLTGSSSAPSVPLRQPPSQLGHPGRHLGGRRGRGLLLKLGDRPLDRGQPRARPASGRRRGIAGRARTSCTTARLRSG